MALGLSPLARTRYFPTSITGGDSFSPAAGSKGRKTGLHRPGSGCPPLSRIHHRKYKSWMATHLQRNVPNPFASVMM